MNGGGKLWWGNGEISILIPHRYVEFSRLSCNNWSDDDAAYAFVPFFKKQVEELGLRAEPPASDYWHNRYKYRNAPSLYLRRESSDHYEVFSPTIETFSKFIGLFGFTVGKIAPFHRKTVIDESRNYSDCEFFRHYEYYIGPVHEMRLIALACPEALSLL